MISSSALSDIKDFNTTTNKINILIKTDIKNSFSYSGLASFYNGVTAYIVSNDGVQKLNNDDFYTITQEQSLAILGHYKVMDSNNVNSMYLLEKINFFLNQVKIVTKNLI